MRDLLSEDDDDRQALKPPTDAPDLLAAHVAWRRAVPKAIQTGLLRGDPLAIVVSVPSASWCRPIRQVLARKLPTMRTVEFDGLRAADLPWNVACFVRDGTERTQGRRDMSAGRLPSHLGRGGTVIGVAADLSLLPPEVLIAADHTIVLSPIRARDVRGIVRRVTASREKADIDERLAAAVGPADLGMAIRPGSSPPTCVARLRRIVDARHVVAGVEDVPRLEDLAGYGAAQDWGLSLVRDVETYRRDPSAMPMTTLQRSVLLAGPPGVGKTMYARALARSAGIPLVVTSYGDWSTYGTGHLNDVMGAAKGAFAEAKAAAATAGIPAILFIDELDSLPSRGSLHGHRNDAWWSSMVNMLLTLTEMSSPARIGLVLIGATNFADRIDPALRRSGRFDTTIHLTLPDVADLAAMVRTHLGDDLSGADLVAVAALAPPSSGADAARWVREARRAARDRGLPMTLDDLVAQVAPPDGRPIAFLRGLARHEAAHAVVSLKIGFGRLRSVSLVSHGRFAGYTAIDDGDEAIPTRADMEAQVVATLAGRAADELFGGMPDAGSGGSRTSDLASATRIVASLHASYGLGATFASLCDPGDVGQLLAVDPGLRATVEADLRRLYAKAKSLVAKHRGAIEAVASALLDARVLSGADVARIVQAAEREERPRTRGRRP